MNDYPATPPPVESAPGTTLTSPPRRRRRLVIPAAVAALALGAVGTGVGYAALGSHQSQASASATRTDRTTQVQPTFNNPYGQSYGGYGYDPYGQQQYGNQQYGDQQTPDTGATGSTDTTAKASGSQLTGLVRIATTLKYDEASAAGTGLVLTSDGEVVTNHHVVAGATSIKVTVMSTGKTYTATVVGTDAKDDVAVLQLSGASGLDTIKNDTDGVTTGEAVTAVGDGNGTVGYLSAATGSVLATDQSITTQAEGAAGSEQLTDLIEISSDVVPGYSGGATYDAQGEVVGMTTAASSGSSDIVGYAVPIAKVLTITHAIEDGTTSTGYTYGYPAFLGIALSTGTTLQGVYDGTPANDAGMAAGDQITSVGGIRTTTAIQLRSAIAAHSPGDDVKVTWTGASGTSHGATVTLAKGPVA
ncbi:MAG: serine protease [Marmoricola sp.]|jgi:S1-C subfamily serine protease|nr:serine protease [Marmoricola sp.]